MLLIPQAMRNKVEEWQEKESFPHFISYGLRAWFQLPTNSFIENDWVIFCKIANTFDFQSNLPMDNDQESEHDDVRRFD